MTRAELDQLAAETIQAQAEVIKALRARLGLDPDRVRLNSPEEDIKRTPLVADAIKQRLDKPASPGASRGTEGFRPLTVGAGTWEPVIEADTKKARLNDGIQTHAEEQELRQKIEALREHNKKIGGTLR